MIWSSQLAACQKSISHSSDISCGPIGMRSCSSCMSAFAQHHQPARVCVHMTCVVQAFEHAVQHLEVAGVTDCHAVLAFVQDRLPLASQLIWAGALA